MANEAEILNNPTSTPAAVSTGYQRQNTNAVAGRVGMDATVVSGGTGKCTLEISGPVDVNGVLYTIDTAVDFILSSADRYYIYLSGSGDNLTPTIDTEPGTFDADKNARYYSGYRVLNWVIDYDGSDSVVSRWFTPEDEQELKTINVEIDGYVHDGTTPISGFLSDGTPYYTKSVSVSIGNGNNLGSAAHGISNAYTNNRIIRTYWYRDTGSVNINEYSRGDGANSDTAIYYVSWGDTNINLRRETSTGDYTYTVYIDYI